MGVADGEVDAIVGLPLTMPKAESRPLRRSSVIAVAVLLDCGEGLGILSIGPVPRDIPALTLTSNKGSPVLSVGSGSRDSTTGGSAGSLVAEFPDVPPRPERRSPKSPPRLLASGAVGRGSVLFVVVRETIEIPKLESKLSKAS